MAFTTRSGRQFFAKETGTTPAVGPGTYTNEPNFQVEHAAAPFSSTTDRGVMGQQHFATPGPGQYYAPKEVGKARASSNNFVSKSSRFKASNANAPDQSPGPGTYESNERWVSQQSKGESIPKHQPRVVWYRAPTAPSIPTHAQSYGYEETRSGELIRQKPPHEGFTGCSNDTVGPAFYNVDASALKGTRATNFGASKSERVAIKAQADNQETPGPGQYNDAAEPAAVRRQHSKPSSGFVSATTRAPAERKIKEVQSLPGPGSYNVPGSIEKPAPVPDRQQYFGSTAKRSFEVQPHSTSAPFCLKTPGPGSYDVAVGINQGKKVQLYDKEQLPFDSTAIRFGDSVPQDIGPGAYDPGNRLNFVSQLGQKTVGRKGIFGSCAPRFIERKAKTQPAPGPGAYEPKAAKGLPGQLRRGPSSVFVSQTQRLAKTTAADGPAPGQYEIPNTIGDVRHGTSRSDVFVSRSARFQGAWGSGGEAPGPGSYDPGAFRMPERKLVDKAVFLSNEQRFKDEQKRRGGSMPGPGAYDEPTNTMLKRSYNVTIEGALS